MSPEVACALDFDMSADIFSYGIVLCEIITGKEPSNQFMCRKPQDLFALNEKEVKNVVLGDCPPQLEALAFACCDIEPRKRPTANICSEELTVSFLSSCFSYRKLVCIIILICR
jgi:LIM domain kinase 1